VDMWTWGKRKGDLRLLQCLIRGRCRQGHCGVNYVNICEVFGFQLGTTYLSLHSPAESLQ